MDWKAIEKARTAHQYQTVIKFFNQIIIQQKANNNLSEAKNAGTNFKFIFKYLFATIWISLEYNYLIHIRILRYVKENAADLIKKGLFNFTN